jgi:serine/threonine protein kinase
MVFEYAEGGTLSDWINKNYQNFDWKNRLIKLTRIIVGLEEIHQKQMIHRDFHAGNILLEKITVFPENIYPDSVYISDMGLSGQINNNTDKTKIYGVLPYVAPEVLNEVPYTQASDIYSFGMIMYFIASGKQPFDGVNYDENLAHSICYNDLRPKIDEQIVPKCYIDLMKRCWDSNADNRPSATEIKELIRTFRVSYLRHDDGDLTEIEKEQRDEIKTQFEQAELNRKNHTYSSSSDHGIVNSNIDNNNTNNSNTDNSNNINNNYNNNAHNNDNNDFSDPQALGQMEINESDEIKPYELNM